MRVKEKRTNSINDQIRSEGKGRHCLVEVKQSKREKSTHGKRFTRVVTWVVAQRV